MLAAPAAADKGVPVVTLPSFAPFEAATDADDVLRADESFAEEGALLLPLPLPLLPKLPTLTYGGQLAKLVIASGCI